MLLGCRFVATSYWPANNSQSQYYEVAPLLLSWKTMAMTKELILYYVIGARVTVLALKKIHLITSMEIAMCTVSRT